MYSKITKFVLILCVICTETLSKPNFLFFLTDDQDSMLGGMEPLRKVKHHIIDKGTEFTNMFVTTPLCCPSRASILTGKYAHNHGVVNNSVSGNCNSALWQSQQEPKSFITFLKKAGYATFYSGKYLNQYGKPSTGGAKHIPVGWDQWITLIGNSCYYNYSLSVNGNKVYHGFSYKDDYLTNIITQEAIQFLHQQNTTQPFFMFLSFPAPHSPFTAAPQYQNVFMNVTAPRNPSFNIHGKMKHWLLRQPPSPLPKFVINKMDQVYRQRWQTLLSVDDSVDEIVKILNKKNMSDTTYIFFTSDNGFHVGQFSLPWDKRQPYEFDIRVPLAVRGPHIKPGYKCEAPVLNIDIAPTILDLASLPIPSEMDGKSFASDLIMNFRTKPARRSSFIVEYHGEASDISIPGCPQYRAGEVHTCEVSCICEDSWNNTYTCIRELSSSENSLACFFKYEKFLELYNITRDPFQLINLASNSHEYKNAFKSHLKLATVI